jgi:hypothetical protein
MQDYEDVLEAIEWICPVTSRWVAHTNSFPARYEEFASLRSPSAAASAGDGESAKK